MVAIEISIRDDYKSLPWTCIIVTSKLASPYVHGAWHPCTHQYTGAANLPP